MDNVEDVIGETARLPFDTIVITEKIENDGAVTSRTERANKDLTEMFTSIEICAGAGGQAVGLEDAGFHHLAVVEIDEHCCTTLRNNRKDWKVLGGGKAGDVTEFNGTPFRGEVDLLAGGVPCPPFSVAGKKLGEADERNLFPEVIRLTDEIRPKAVMIENVPGLLSSEFDYYRREMILKLKKLGYIAFWEKFNASDYGVPQLRPRAILLAFEKDLVNSFSLPQTKIEPETVGQSLKHLMAENGWKLVDDWVKKANTIAPTIVGGSKKHGGPDLGPTRAKRAWAGLGVNGHLIAAHAPSPDFVGMPCLTVQMVAKLQGFPENWIISGKKTNAYRQVGNAFPPPVARAIGERIIQAFRSSQKRQAAR